MEGLAPSLKLALALRLGLERGVPLRISLKEYLHQNQDQLCLYVSRCVSLKEQGKAFSEFTQNIKSPYQRALMHLIDRGLSGESILNQLVLLEEEIKEACFVELDERLASLPIKALIPLLLFQFPALLLLLFAPFLNQLTQALQ